MKKQSHSGSTNSLIIRWIVYLATLLTFGSLLYILFFIFIKGIPNISLELFEWNFNSSNQSLVPSLINTIIVVGLTLLFATPIGVFTGVYLVEYADRTSKVTQAISMATDTLQAVPSIVYGLFGMLFFRNTLGLGYSVLAGVLTVTIMVLPLIIRSTEEAMISVDRSLREASYGLGAGKIRTIFQVVLPVAMPGIVSGVILASGRVIGETAALIFTLGTAPNMATGLLQTGRTMAVHMYVLTNEGRNVDKAFATAVVLVLFVIVVNALANWISDKILETGAK
ncbi:MAG: phosphate ABC transporter permease PstA [Atopococcus tabaci]|uniref:Phosphate transport system permease protein PstA n=1 Tax=Atopococcus tabaci TaxID=269774 RepID=A0AA43UCE3_9LACT|nr:phosphate ABC transporter permease PstA [Atopococcus tabaci]